ncbi:hypothetical protein NE237_005117 [Protea cynaroides]|uniref:Uncharacterized protein n=1 Tax=Protea cynaroides TaxID=273540 RepID=A0A9Q0KJW3_9MAGN|nr:hypothetical protein NE237_005117 [Protea cynaroides]
MLQTIVRMAIAAARTRNSLNHRHLVVPSTIKLTYSHFSSKVSSTKGKSKAKVKSKKETCAKIDEISTATSDDLDSDLLDEDSRARHLAEDEKDKSLDVGPNGRPLFTSTKFISKLSRKDVCT